MPPAAHAAAALLATLALGAGCRSPEPEPDSFPGSPPETVASGTLRDAPGFLYGRVVTHGGDLYEGRLRWGGDEEAFWDHAFNGRKDQNPWAHHTPLAEQAEKRRPVLFGIELPTGEPRVDLGRPFMARFGDLARIESVGDGVRGMIEDRTDFDPDVRVTMKSGTTFDLARLEASDFDDGVRVWDRERGVVDLSARDVRAIDFLPTPALRGVPARLHGTVQTGTGAFTGSIQWDREEALATDVLRGDGPDGAVAYRFGDVQAIAREPGGGSRVALRDGGSVALSGHQMVDRGNRGIYVDDPRYGRVLVSWDAFQRASFEDGGSGPSYDSFAPGRPLAGTVATRDGRHLAGRLVFDLDESETTETLDAPADGIDYSIPFALVRAIALPSAPDPATVTLQSGETLQLDRSGDLGDDNGGLLVFAENEESPQYVPWPDVERIDFGLDGEVPED